MKVRWCVCVLAVSMFFSCASIPDKKKTEKIRAAHELSAKKVTLLERENSVIKKENTNYRKELLDLQARMEKSLSDYETLKKKYDEDIALAQTKYQNVQTRNTILEKESGEKIKELTELNKAIEKKMQDEIGRLTTEMKKASEDFSAEREKNTLAFAKKEKELSTAVNDLEVEKNNLAKENGDFRKTTSELEASLKKISDELARKDAELKKAKEERDAAVATSLEKLEKKEEK